MSRFYQNSFSRYTPYNICHALSTRWCLSGPFAIQHLIGSTHVITSKQAPYSVLELKEARDA
jgi:hypothetical protein